MVELFGRTLTRRELEERSGALGQFAGVRLMELGDGVERGIRLLDFRTGTGMRFTVLIDRAFDIAECEHNGKSVAWHSPAGFRHPGLAEAQDENGLGWLRNFSGLLVTCGLDHTLGGQEVPADTYFHRQRQTAKHTIHGRVSTIPAKLSGYGERWEGDRCFLWAEGIVQQATVFGEDLHLIRRIEAEIGTSEIRLTDRVVNHGFYRTPHMLLYHINVGAPLLDEGARYLAPIRDVIMAAHAATYRDQHVGYQRIPAPQHSFYEQVWQHEMAADAAGEVPVAVVNDRLGLGFELTTRKDQLPCFYEWQHFQAGQYTLGIEPATHHVTGNLKARERNEMIWLEHGDERRYDVSFRVLPDAAAIAATEARIRAIAVQPAEDYPLPSGSYPPIPGRT